MSKFTIVQFQTIIMDKNLDKDEFKIRYWRLNILDTLLVENGFSNTLKAFPQFNSTGSTNKL